MTFSWQMVGRGSVLAQCLGLLACGGGDPDPPPGVGEEVVTPAPIPWRPFALYAGYYGGALGTGGGTLLVHPDGTVFGDITLLVTERSGDHTAFLGSLREEPTALVASGARFFHKSGPFVWDPGPFTPYVPNPQIDQVSLRQGTADVRLIKAESASLPALRAEVERPTIANPFPPITYVKGSWINPAFQNLPFSKLGGRYTDGETIPSRGQNATLDASTGSLAGTYFRNCQVAGTVYAYDPETTMFRLDATFQGAGCEEAGVGTGSGTFLGRLGSTRYGRLVLDAKGVVTDRVVDFSLEHSQVLPY